MVRHIHSSFLWWKPAIVDVNLLVHSLFKSLNLRAIWKWLLLFQRLKRSTVVFKKSVVFAPEILGGSNVLTQTLEIHVQITIVRMKFGENFNLIVPAKDRLEYSRNTGQQR